LSGLAARIGPTPADLGQDEAANLAKWAAAREVARHWLTGADPLPDTLSV
jgi:hypothetical protein